MNRNDIVLAILASAGGASLTPVQLQKAAFLIDRNAPYLFDEGSRFNFVPYDYGPFDRAVYDEAIGLSMRGLGAVAPSPYGKWNVYAATEAGVNEGTQVLQRMPVNVQNYIREVTAWVRAQSFGSLVKSIYDSYPEMRENSVFQG